MGPVTTRLPGISFRLPNARAGEAYAQPMLTLPEQAPAVVFERIAIDPALGLSADVGSGLVSGTPTQAGEHRIQVSYRLAGQATLIQASVTLSVIANPRSMWKNLPSDHAALYWRPDEACSMERGPAFTLVGASKRGRSHAHAGLFRDDDFALAHTGASGWHIAVAADGAGSARLSRRGAQLACHSALAYLAQCLDGTTGRLLDHAANAKDENAMHEALLAALGGAATAALAAVQQACQEGAQVKDFSTTALYAICKRYAGGTLCAAYQVGDGAVGAYSKTGGITLLGTADAGEFAGETRFLDQASTSPAELGRRVRHAWIDELTALVLMTDGISDPKFETESRLAANADWHALWAELEVAAGLHAVDANADKLLAWLDFWSSGNHDDRTIAIIYQQECPQ
jgi:hypothetical protein